eukprot:12647856-Heterocapsa_arctica.AAC.1
MGHVPDEDTRCCCDSTRELSAIVIEAEEARRARAIGYRSRSGGNSSRDREERTHQVDDVSPGYRACQVRVV